MIVLWNHLISSHAQKLRCSLRITRYQIPRSLVLFFCTQRWKTSLLHDTATNMDHGWCNFYLDLVFFILSVTKKCYVFYGVLQLTRSRSGHQLTLSELFIVAVWSFKQVSGLCVLKSDLHQRMAICSFFFYARINTELGLSRCWTSFCNFFSRMLFHIIIPDYNI